MSISIKNIVHGNFKRSDTYYPGKVVVIEHENKNTLYIAEVDGEIITFNDSVMIDDCVLNPLSDKKIYACIVPLSKSKLPVLYIVNGKINNGEYNVYESDFIKNFLANNNILV